MFGGGSDRSKLASYFEDRDILVNLVRSNRCDHKKHVRFFFGFAAAAGAEFPRDFGRSWIRLLHRGSCEDSFSVG